MPLLLEARDNLVYFPVIFFNKDSPSKVVPQDVETPVYKHSLKMCIYKIIYRTTRRILKLCYTNGASQLTNPAIKSKIAKIEPEML